MPVLPAVNDMVLTIQHAAHMLGIKRTYQYTSERPYIHEDEAPAGCHWEFDYEWEQESAEDAPLVFVTHVRLMTHSGQEYPIKVADLDGRWIAEVEALISDELAASVDSDD